LLGQPGGAVQFRAMFVFRRKQAAPGAIEASTWRKRGNEALASARLEEAARCYLQAIALEPSEPLARVNLGYVLIEAGKPSDAITALQQAISLAQSNPDALADAQFLLARAHRSQGQHGEGEALAALHAALRARPAFTEAAQELVPLLIASGKEAEALECAERLARDAGGPLSAMLLAQAQHATGDADAALATLESVLRHDPGHLGALEASGNLMLELGRPEEALGAFERVLAQHGREPDALANASAALLRLGRANASLALAEEALRKDPEHRVSWHNKACALIDLLRLAEARDAALAGLRLSPGDPDLQWNAGVAHLLLGEFMPGWKAHESRWRAKGFAQASGAPAVARPAWTGGETLAGRSILLYAEQGLGDSIHFLRYVPLVARSAASVVLQVQPSLLPLVQGLAPNCRAVGTGDPLPPTDLQCPLLSLPHAFGTTLSSVPATVPYLSADPVLAGAWQERLPANAGRPRVGVTWSGNPSHGNDSNRSIALAAFRDVAVEGCQFVGLQPQVRASDHAALEGWRDLFDAGPRLRSFADTAALLQALDLVIAVDTSVAHMAGALGRPVWILLPFAPDWRWMVERDDSPWYPSARLYRQGADRAWGPVLARVRADLAALANGRELSRSARGLG
jgi:tetratricopeptide (TPR) repeat protein